MFESFHIQCALTSYPCNRFYWPDGHANFTNKKWTEKIIYNGRRKRTKEQGQEKKKTE
jgi:hypothetical protein